MNPVEPCDDEIGIGKSPIRPADQPAPLPDETPSLASAHHVSDPWAHRRGEPRLFAFLWTMFVLANLAGSLTWVASSAAITATSYSPAARIMLVVISIGITVLWPMTRLSQLSPRGSTLAAALQDLVVVLVPVHLVIWPLTFLAHWPVDVVAALAALLSSWGLLVASVLAVALARPRVCSTAEIASTGRRSLWMLALLTAVLVAPLGRLLALRGQGAGGGGALTDPGVFTAMLSPLTGIPALTGRGLTGPMAPVSDPQWWAIVATALISVLVWAAAVLLQDGDTTP